MALTLQLLTNEKGKTFLGVESPGLTKGRTKLVMSVSPLVAAAIKSVDCRDINWIGTSRRVSQILEKNVNVSQVTELL